MSYYIIDGGHRLEGVVTISGSKNAALAIIPATILSGKPCRIENLPQIEDVRALFEILELLGARVNIDTDGGLLIDPTTIDNSDVTCEKVKALRASYYFLGALLGRYGEVRVALPGGCPIGPRPIDLHIKGMKALGAEIKIEDNIIHARCKQLVGAEMYLDFASVGATINIMLAASRAVGVTTINNAAKEPHVVDVANFLNMCGAKVRGAGTDIIRITGVKTMHGSTYAIIPDQIESGTFMIAAAATRGDVILKNIIPAHLEAISAKLMESGVRVTERDDGREYYLRVQSDVRPRAVNIKTLCYPGFPTDLQQPMMALLSVAKGESRITETIFEERFNHVKELVRMGANITLHDQVAIINGVDTLKPADLYATDLRACASLVVAALMAEGESRVYNIKYMDRGYEFLEKKLIAVGAVITRKDD
ncbi:MAG: UDP-N-acetylglucosamine 1-carboxyvinyltransferase [Clostridia bacterium]